MGIIKTVSAMALGAGIIAAGPAQLPRALDALHTLSDRLAWSGAACRDAPAECEAFAARQLAAQHRKVDEARDQLLLQDARIVSEMHQDERELAAARALKRQIEQLRLQSPEGDDVLFAGRRTNSRELAAQARSLDAEIATREAALQRFGRLRGELGAAVENTAAQGTTLRSMAVELPARAQLRATESIGDGSALTARFFDDPTRSAGPRTVEELMRSPEAQP